MDEIIYISFHIIKFANILKLLKTAGFFINMFTLWLSSIKRCDELFIFQKLTAEPSLTLSILSAHTN